MMFRQLIEYSMSNIVLEKEYTKCDEEVIPRPFSKKSKLSLSLGQQPEFLLPLFVRRDLGTTQLVYRDKNFLATIFFM